MKALLLLTDVFGSYGGIQTFNRTLVKAFGDLAESTGFQPTVLALNDPALPTGHERYLGKAVYRGFGRKKGAFLTAALRQAVEAEAIVLGHVNFLPIAHPLTFAAPSARVFLTVFGIDAWDRLPPLRRAALSRIDRILSISEFTKSRMIHANGTEDGRFRILPCSLDPFYGQEFTGSVHREGRDVTLLSVSRLDQQEPYKKVELVIRALPRLCERHPQTRYVVVGDGTDRDRLVTLARDLGVADRITFAGKVDSRQLSQFYRDCDIFVLPSLREGFGIVFLEAMFFAKPCVGARAAAVPEVIQHEETGFLSEPDDVESLASHLDRLVSDTDLRRRMGLAGKHRLETEFSFATFRNRIASVLADLPA